MATQRAAGIYPLDDLDGHTVAKGDPDPRGWDVYSSDNRKLGKVKDLLVEVPALVARYLDVELAKDVAGERDHHVLLPIGTARLDDEDDRVTVQTTATNVRALPAYNKDNYKGGAIQRDYEDSLLRGIGTAGSAGTATRPGANYYDRPEFDASRFYGTRSTRTARETQPADRRGEWAKEGEKRVTLAEEELRLGKRQVEAGQVELRKTVETEHVSEKVPLTREEVTVERRPISGAAATNAQIGEDQIRVPVMAEEAVVDKRVVPKEEVIVKKRAVTEEQTVEADLRRERLDVDDNQVNAAAARGTKQTAKDTGRTPAPDARSGARGLADRVADKVDDLKDRVDANPASRPGRDATDRPGR